MNIEEFNYELPEELIAQDPIKNRTKSRLMVLNKNKQSIEHKYFEDIIEYLKEGDCLVLNNSRVIPARLYGNKDKTGAKIEFLLTKQIDTDIWETLVKPGKKLKPGNTVVFGENKILKAHVLDYGQDGTRIVRFEYEGIFEEILDTIGIMPLPPYIKNRLEDKERYQTVYSKYSGSVAAPTAGLHFTKELLEKIKNKNIKIAYVTLHVGIGTFRPVKCDNIKDHKMHFESYFIDNNNAQIINEAREKGGRIIAVGTTSARTLESIADLEGKIKSKSGDTNLFIYPGYKFKIVDALITNFHLPKSTLLMLVSALYDKDKVLEAYNEAVKQKYRFFSFGDAMFIY